MKTKLYLASMIAFSFLLSSHAAENGARGVVARRIAHLHHRGWCVGHQLGRRAADCGRFNEIRRFTMVIVKQLQFLSTCLICLWLCVVSAQSQKPTMKAVVVHEYGGPEVLKYEAVPRS